MAISDIVVEIAFATNPLATPTWTDVTQYAVTIDIARGPATQIGEFPAGTCTVVFNNEDGRFDPDNTGSPYRSGGNTQVLPRKRLRVRHSTDDLFVGFGLVKDSWQPSYDAMNQFSTMTFTAHDYLGILATAELDPVASTGGGDTPSTRLTSVFNEVGAPLSTDLDTGLVALSATTKGEKAGAHARDVVLAEGGSLYVHGDGQVVFDDRYAPVQDTRMNTSQHTFNDSGGTPFRTIERGYVDQVLNLVRVSREGGTEQIAEDTASQTSYGVGELTSTGLQLQANDNEVLGRAQWWLEQYKDPVFRPAMIELHPYDSTVANILTQAVTRKLRDRITVAFTPVGGAGVVSHQCLIDGIRHNITMRPGQDWRTQFVLSSAERFDFAANPFLLNDATDGLLNTGTLGW